MSLIIDRIKKNVLCCKINIKLESISRNETLEKWERLQTGPESTCACRSFSS
jgi:hypothetical protein